MRSASVAAIDWVNGIVSASLETGWVQVLTVAGSAEPAILRGCGRKNAAVDELAGVVGARVGHRERRVAGGGDDVGGRGCRVVARHAGLEGTEVGCRSERERERGGHGAADAAGGAGFRGAPGGAQLADVERFQRGAAAGREDLQAVAAGRGVDLVGDRALAVLGEDLDERAVDEDAQVQATVAQRHRRGVHAGEAGQRGGRRAGLRAVDRQRARGDVIGDRRSRRRWRWSGPSGPCGRRCPAAGWHGCRARRRAW